MKDAVLWRSSAALALASAISCFCAGSLWAGNVYYVSPDGSPEESGGEGTLVDPYDLKTGIAKATGNADELRFLYGTYLLDSQIDLKASVSYRGWNGDVDAPAGKEGRHEVVIDGQGTWKGFVGANLVGGNLIADLTVSNTANAALSFTNAGGTTVTNCVIVGNISGRAVSGGGYKQSLLKYIDCDIAGCRGTGTAIAGDFNALTEVVRCRFYDNVQTTTKNAYGSIFSASGAPFTDCIVSNNAGVGHGILYGGVDASFRSCVFCCNTNSADGGVMYLADGQRTAFFDCTFERNSATTGGCLSSGLISGNSVGGAVWATNCTFRANSSTSAGGVQYWQTGSAANPGCTNEYIDCKFFCNEAGSSGGVLYEYCVMGDGKDGCRTFVTNCTFAGNHAASSGGAIANAYVSLGTIVCCDSTFVTNSASSGGALATIAAGGAGQCRNLWAVTNCTFRGNVAANGGGTYNAHGVFSKCSFVENVASNSTQTGQAACFFMFGGNQYNTYEHGFPPLPLEIDGCGFTNNFTYGKGASVLFGKASSGNDVFSKNPYIISNMSLRVSNSSFVGNRNTVRDNLNASGGSVLSLIGFRDFAVVNSVFRENVSYGYGVAIGNTMLSGKSSSLTNGIVRNCLFFGNQGVGAYGGVTASTCYLGEANTFVDSCSFVSNALPSGAGAGLCLGGDAPATGRVRNTLFYRNKSTNGTEPDIKTSADNLALAFSNCFETRGILTGPGCIGKDLDPKLVDWEHGDCRLAFGSPCINVGLNEPWMVGARDLQNNRKIPRIINGIVDIGCYEYRPTPGLLLLLK